MTFGGLTIPRPASIRIDRELIGERSRTASGKDRMDVVAVKRRWRVETSPLTAAEANAITLGLQSSLYTTDDFQCADMGAPVLARIDPDSLGEEIVPFGKDGWEQWGRVLSFDVIES